MKGRPDPLTNARQRLDWAEQALREQRPQLAEEFLSTARSALAGLDAQQPAVLEQRRRLEVLDFTPRGQA